MLHVSQRKVLLGPVPAVDILDQHVLAGFHRDHFGTITCRDSGGMSARAKGGVEALRTWYVPCGLSIARHHQSYPCPSMVPPPVIVMLRHRVKAKAALAA